jgi:5-methylcytosine-specific restriction endonuclease McrA
MSVLHLPTLILNKSWVPIYFDTVREAITKIYTGHAAAIDSRDESMETHDWNTWHKLPVSGLKPFIRTAHTKILSPEIITLHRYSKIPKTEIKLTRRNLMIRDGFRCQYTGEILTLSTATIDHVIPRSRGGKTTWTNVVLACRDVNMRKANKTPKEAGLTLLTKPHKPHWDPLYSRYLRKVPLSWRKFLTAPKYENILIFEEKLDWAMVSE